MDVLFSVRFEPFPYNHHPFEMAEFKPVSYSGPNMTVIVYYKFLVFTIHGFIVK